MNNAAMNMGMQISLEVLILFPLDIPRKGIAGSCGNSEKGLLNHIVVLFFKFLRNFHTVFYNGYANLPPAVRKSSLLSTFFPTLGISFLFVNSHPSRCEVVFIYISLMSSDFISFRYTQKRDCWIMW